MEEFELVPTPANEAAAQPSYPRVLDGNCPMQAEETVGSRPGALSGQLPRLVRRAETGLGASPPAKVGCEACNLPQFDDKDIAATVAAGGAGCGSRRGAKTTHPVG